MGLNLDDDDDDSSLDVPELNKETVESTVDDEMENVD